MIIGSHNGGPVFFWAITLVWLPFDRAFNDGQIIESTLSARRRAKFLPSVAGGIYEWFRYEGHLGNIGLMVMRKANPYTPFVSEDVHAAKGEKSLALLAYWESLCRDGKIPGWQDFDLMANYRFAASLAVLDVEGTRENPKFRYRYTGTNLVETREGLENRDPTGKLFDEVPRSYDFTPILDTYAACVAKKKPFLIAGSFMTFRQFGYGERMIVPLSSSGIEVDKLVTCLDRLQEKDIPT